jgi:hypothetical protein
MPIGEWRLPLFMERVKTSSSTGQLSWWAAVLVLQQGKRPQPEANSYGFQVDIRVS